MVLSDVCLSVAYIGPTSRTERPRKTKIGTEVAHVSRDSDTTVKVKVKVTRPYPHSLFAFAIHDDDLRMHCLNFIAYQHTEVVERQHNEARYRWEISVCLSNCRIASKRFYIASSFWGYAHTISHIVTKFYVVTKLGDGYTGSPTDRP